MLPVTRDDVIGDSALATFILVFASLDVAGWVESPSLSRLLVRATWWLLYVAVTIRLFQRDGIGWITWLMRRQALLGLLMALALLSAVWSLAPSESFHMAGSLMATTLLGVYIGYAVSPSAMEKSLSVAFAVVIVSSLVALPLLPHSIVIEPWTGQWRGLTDHKNALGAISALALLFYASGVVRGRAVSPGRVAMCFACLLALVLSRSVTAQIAGGVGLAALRWLVAAPTWLSSRRARRTLLLATGIAGALLFYWVGPITHALGRDATFNGRTPLWAASWRIVRERPLTGYGYHVVWWKHEGTLLPHIPETAGYQASSAHNAFLNTATELGVPAAVLLASFIVGVLIDAIRFERRRRSPLSLFAVTSVLTVMTLDLAESYLLGIHSVLWILTIATAVMLRRSCDDAEGARL
jgi:exopolysaccharide production protein ExoQ